MAVSFDTFTIMSDGFVLCRDDGAADESTGTFWVDKRDETMTTDNLRFFKVVKLPRNANECNKDGLNLRLGDRIMSIATGTDVHFPDRDKAYKLFDLKYIVAKVD